MAEFTSLVDDNVIRVEYRFDGKVRSLDEVRKSFRESFRRARESTKVVPTTVSPDASDKAS